MASGGNAFDIAFNAVLNGTGTRGPNLNATMKHVRTDQVATYTSLSKAVVMGEPSSRVSTVSIGSIATHHPGTGGGSANFLFLDGHVDLIPTVEANLVSAGSGPPNASIWQTARGKIHWGVFGR